MSKNINKMVEQFEPILLQHLTEEVEDTSDLWMGCVPRYRNRSGYVTEDTLYHYFKPFYPNINTIVIRKTLAKLEKEGFIQYKKIPFPDQPQHYINQIKHIFPGEMLKLLQ